VIAAFEHFYSNPRPGEVYNLGGGRGNSASVLECIELIHNLSPYRVQYTLSDTNRTGDHICYISDCRKLQRDYPGWRVRTTLKEIVENLIAIQEKNRNREE
jgi:CDP-paratose 2-epimerase